VSAVVGAGGRQAGGGFGTALVTGGGSGIGLALGTELARNGASVVLADLDGDSAARAAEQLSQGGGNVVGRALDVTDLAAFSALADEVVADHGRLDLLFNNAGVSLGGPTHELTAAHWDRIIDVNIRGVVNGILAVYPGMVEQRHGCIVNTASGAGLVAPPFVAAYAATKHAVVGLSTALRPEAALHGVHVNVLCPGAVETPILDQGPDPGLPPLSSRTVTAREYLALVGQKPMPASAFARRALDGVARNRAVIVVPRSTRALWYLHRLSPAVTEMVTRRLARKVERDLVRPVTGEG
jgi:NAD(P)-dependent dehydrogenase (short-subunit alcohol dehydrogenase family)